MGSSSLLGKISLRVALMLPLMITACGVEHDGDDIHSQVSGIYNGTDDTTHTSVVKLSLPSGSCTGTFIAKNYIITAAHCLPDCPQPSGVACKSQSGSLSGSACDALVLDGTCSTGTTYSIDYAIVPSSVGWPDGPPDVAILRTTTNFSGNTASLMGSSKMPTGQNIGTYTNVSAIAVGYSGLAMPDWRRRQGTATISGIDLNPPNRAFRVTFPANQTVCPGDSGGPLFLSNAYTGVKEVGGVSSLGGANCYNNPPTGSYIADYAYIPRSFIDDTLCGSGWEFLDGNSHNKAAASRVELIRHSSDGRMCRYKYGSAANVMAILRDDGRILKYSVAGESWELVDDNPACVQIAIAGANNYLFQRHSSGVVWVHDGGFRHWHTVDSSTDSNRTIAGGPDMYELNTGGYIWKCNFNGSSCALQKLDDNVNTTSIAAGAGGLFQMHGGDGSYTIWKSLGGFRNWQLVDQNIYSREITVDSTTVYQRHSNQYIFRWDGPYWYSWTKLDDNYGSRQIVGRSHGFYQRHLSGNIWKSNGCFRCWTNLGGQDFNVSTLFGNEGTR